MMRPQTGSGSKASLTLVTLALMFAGLLAGSGAPAQSAGAAEYTVTDLGTLPGASSSGAEAINDSGQVVGWSGTHPGAGDTRGFLWQDGAMTDLGSLGGGDYSRAFDVNGSGQVVGDSSYPVDTSGNGPTKAFRWQNGTMTDLGSLLPEPYEESHAYATNGSGQVVGKSLAEDDNGDRWDHAFLYHNGQMTDLGILAPDGAPGDSVAHDINGSGQVVGEADLEDFAGTHAFLYESGQMTDLGTLGGSNFSVAYDINDVGQVVGESGLDGFLWQNGAMASLGDIEPAAINDAGQVVGSACLPDGGEGCKDQAVVYQGGQMQRLNNLTDPASGWDLHRATDINEEGQIVGTGTISSEEHAFLLTPQQDTEAPTVTGVSPTGRGISPTADVTATFSEGMDAGTITTGTFELVKKGTTQVIGAEVAYDAAAKKATLDPIGKLKRGATYRATVTTGAEDAAGNALDQDPITAGDQSKTWRFKVSA
ncbi:MAG: Ig-like domain-containing protein [Actinomycetota bacterium]|nr:Ig-like domain-containing protein [Actinomycetota bacterium]